MVTDHSGSCHLINVQIFGRSAGPHLEFWLKFTQPTPPQALCKFLDTYFVIASSFVFSVAPSSDATCLSLVCTRAGSAGAKSISHEPPSTPSTCLGITPRSQTSVLPLLALLSVSWRAAFCLWFYLSLSSIPSVVLSSCVLHSQALSLRS